MVKLVENILIFGLLEELNISLIPRSPYRCWTNPELRMRNLRQYHMRFSHLSELHQCGFPSGTESTSPHSTANTEPPQTPQTPQTPDQHLLACLRFLLEYFQHPERKRLLSEPLCLNIQRTIVFNAIKHFKMLFHQLAFTGRRAVRLVNIYLFDGT